MVKQNDNASFLGRGWSFPPEFNRSMNNIEMSEGEEDIKESIEILLSTQVGERMMHPDFGCNLERLMFENLDLTLQRYIKDLIQTAILKYETRINLEEISFHPEPQYGRIIINIQYTIRSTNTRTNLVYPYYLIEGTNL
jgi:phage baseplate assembly protein W